VVEMTWKDFAEKHKEKFQKSITFILGFFLSIGLILWMITIFLQVAKTNFDAINSYEQISLTLFGFTLIGGIFEAKKPEEIKFYGNLFGISLGFLASFILFLVSDNLKLIYSISNEGLVLLGLIIVVLAASFIFVFEIASISMFLYRYYKEKYTTTEKSKI
jgi:hypothetical protein